MKQTMPSLRAGRRTAPEPARTPSGGRPVHASNGGRG